MLETFWRMTPGSSPRIRQAALQYGPYAVACHLAIAVEVAVLARIWLVRGSGWVWMGAVGEAGVLVSTWWALVRLRALRTQTAD